MPVQFNERLNTTLHMVTWTFAYRAARKGSWEQSARDRERFSRKIGQCAVVINKILDPQHRSIIYLQRFI